MRVRKIYLPEVYPNVVEASYTVVQIDILEVPTGKINQ